MKVWIVWQVTADEYNCNDIKVLHAIYGSRKVQLRKCQEGNDKAREDRQDYYFEAEDKPRNVICPIQRGVYDNFVRALRIIKGVVDTGSRFFEGGDLEQIANAIDEVRDDLEKFEEVQTDVDEKDVYET